MKLWGADEFHENFGGDKPGNIGSDFKVYTGEGDNVLAYRGGIPGTVQTENP